MYLCAFTLSQARDINEAACRIAREVADEQEGVLVCGGLTHVRYKDHDKNPDKYQVRNEYARNEMNKQLQTFIDHDVDFVLGEVSVCIILTF